MLPRRPELSHAGPMMSTAKAELEALLGAGCGEWLGDLVMRIIRAITLLRYYIWANFSHPRRLRSNLLRSSCTKT